MSQQIIWLLEECVEHLSFLFCMRDVGIVHATQVRDGFINFPLIENSNIA